MGYGNWLGHCIHFCPHFSKDSVLRDYENIDLGLDVLVVENLVSKLLVMQITNYHIVMDNWFTSSALLSHLRTMGVAATGTWRANQMENASLRDMVKINKKKCRLSDVVTDVSSNISAVCWKDNKVMNVISTFTGKQPIQ